MTVRRVAGPDGACFPCISLGSGRFGLTARFRGAGSLQFQGLAKKYTLDESECSSESHFPGSGYDREFSGSGP